ncbi:hypothetical protein PV08_08686 [Exophiala spinifera]|uniref:Extracellular membrane protein CFEM domain-containing protein n=1 Tax=Exophiala spinifera TaxID=91928 RepID=A0A0D2B3R1_9EURO|nr:uncharacterized protein PV08_08686 [Exophiala spinifera]KIW13498.1 hypothetical protein PV08_08686 [Exophiala spinifera]
MLNLRNLAWTAFLFASYSCSQATQSLTSLDTSICNVGSPLTTFSACNYLNDQLNYCAGPQVASGAPFVSCYCNQKVFNAFYDCESEYRLCLLNDYFDGDAQNLISLWNSACDDAITFSPTTPVLSTLTSTYDVGYCTTAQSACAVEEVALSSCSVNYLGKDDQKFSSCFCAPSFLSAQYTCGFLGNVSCQQVPATLTNLVGYSYCSNFMSVLGGSSGSVPASVSANSTGTSSASHSTAHLSSSASSTFSITTPALPGSSSAGGPSAPTSTRNSADRRNLSGATVLSAAVFLILVLIL